MSSPIILPAFGNVRNLVVPNTPGEGIPAALAVNPRGEQLVNQVLPERAELVRLGNSFVIKTAAVVCVTALPTTTAPAHIWNGEPPGGKTYVIDGIAWTCTTSAGAASMFGLIAQVNILPVTANPATTDTLVASSLNGRKYAGRAGMGHTATVVNDNWIALGNNVSTPLTATVGLSLDVPVQGLIQIPPGYLLGLGVVAVNATAAGMFCVRYHEVQLTEQT